MSNMPERQENYSLSVGALIAGVRTPLRAINCQRRVGLCGRQTLECEHPFKDLRKALTVASEREALDKSQYQYKTGRLHSPTTMGCVWW